MRIDRVTVHHLCIPFRNSFVHATKSRSQTETVIVVAASDQGVEGVGEILPRPYLTGESISSVLSTELPNLIKRWLGRKFESIGQVVAALQLESRHNTRPLATLAGWELALLDLAGQTYGMRAGDTLGPVLKKDLETGIVIDFAVPTDSLERYCMRIRISGLRNLKVKVGHNNDDRRLEIVSGVLGAQFPLRIDANGIWGYDQAIQALSRMRRFNIQSVEQPVPAHDICGLRKIRENTGVAVVADESLCSFEDGQALIRAQAVDVFNVRVGKCGGLLASKALVQLAREAGLQCHLGTLVGETGILAWAAETLASRVEGFEFIEGRNQNRLLLIRDIVEVPPPTGSACRNGLGIRLAQGSLRDCSVSSQTTFNTNNGGTA